MSIAECLNGIHRHAWHECFGAIDLSQLELKPPYSARLLYGARFFTVLASLISAGEYGEEYQAVLLLE